MEQIKEYFPRALLERYGESLEDASAHAAAAVEEVVARLAALSPQQAAAPVAPGKWSPLQVADHLHRVNLLAIEGIARVSRGEEPVRTERGSVTADGGLVVGLTGAEPAADPSLAQVTADLRSSNAALAEAAVAAQASGLGAEVVNVNPFFGELSPLDSVRMAALHARHHIRKHLAG
ncbi:MAG: DinB family protein [Trueperaceae bacterium]